MIRILIGNMSEDGSEKFQFWHNPIFLGVVSIFLKGVILCTTARYRYKARIQGQGVNTLLLRWLHGNQGGERSFYSQKIMIIQRLLFTVWLRSITFALQEPLYKYRHT
jgi:hypothetical protein